VFDTTSFAAPKGADWLLNRGDRPPLETKVIATGLASDLAARRPRETAGPKQHNAVNTKSEMPCDALADPGPRDVGLDRSAMGGADFLRDNQVVFAVYFGQEGRAPTLLERRLVDLDGQLDILRVNVPAA
jgi:hypothetical protein